MLELGADAERATAQSQWRARLQRFAQAGCSMAQFCAAEGVSRWSFCRWRRKVGGGVSPKRPTLAAARAKASAVLPGGGFIDDGVARVGGSEPQATIASAAAVELRLELGGGVVLQAPTGPGQGRSGRAARRVRVADQARSAAGCRR